MPGYDVFVSYRHADARRVRPMVEALRRSGLLVWIDEHEIADFAGITRSIADGLAKAKALVAWYSSIYPRSRPCQWELTAAFLAAQRDADPGSRVLVVNPEQGTDHIHPLELRDALFRTAPAPDDAAAHRALAEAVATHVAALEGRLGEIRALTPPRWVGWSGVGSNRFVGRLPEMWRIHSGLHASGFAIATGAAGSGLVQLVGTGGMGKSLLAEEYALRFGAAFPGGVFWLSAHGHDDANAALRPEEREAERTAQIRDIAGRLGLPTRARRPAEIESHLARELEHRAQPFLWVVDDVPAGLDVQAFRGWFAPHSLGKTLITARGREHDALGTQIPIGVLEEREAVELITSRRAPANEDEQREARAIASELGYHALAVDVAGGALRRTSYGEFRLALADPDADALALAEKLAGQLPNGHERSIARTLRRSIDLLEAPGRDFLRLASVLAVAPIPAALVAAVLAATDGLEDATARARAALGMHEVEQLSLAETAGDAAAALLVHTLISRTVRLSSVEADRRARLRQAAVQVLHAALPRVGERWTRADAKGWVGHARALAAHADDAMTADLVGQVAGVDLERGDFRSASDLFGQQLAALRRLLGDGHPGTLAATSNLALALHSGGDLQQARRFHEEALEVYRQVLRAGPPGSALTVMGNLGETLRAMGDLDRAREIEERVVELRVRLNGAEHPDTLTSMINLALTLHSQGALAAAQRLQEGLLDVARRVLDADHPSTLRLMSNLAATLQEQGDFRRARQQQEQARELQLRVLGPEHPDVLTSTNNLAVMLRAQGDVAGARRMQEQLVELSRRVLGAEHPETLAAMNNLGVTLREQDHLAAARRLQEEVIEKCGRVLGRDHPGTLRATGNLADTLRAQQDLAGAQSLREQLLAVSRRVLGAEHPDTLAAMGSLAEALWAQGDLGGARRLEEQVLATLRRVLGPRHPETSVAAWNAVITMTNMGDHPAARSVVEMDLQWLLECDPDTLGAKQRQLRETLRDWRGQEPGG